MRCSACGAENFDSADTCMECGLTLRRATSTVDQSVASGPPAAGRPTAPKSGPIIAVIAVVLGVIIVALMLSAGAGSGGSGFFGGRARVGASTTPKASVVGSDSPVATSIALARKGWPSGAPGVVIVPAQDVAAAAVAGPLAAVLGGPVLLADGVSPGAEVLAEVDSLSPSEVYILDSRGGGSAYAPALSRSGRTVKTIAGQGAASLSSKVAAEMGSRGQVEGIVFVTEANLDRAIVAAPYSSGFAYPVLIGSGPDPQQHADTIQSLDPPVALVLESSATVTADAVAKAGHKGLIDRVDAGDLQTFARLMGEYEFAHGFKYDTVYAVTQGGIAHAYCAGPFAALRLSPLVVTEDKNLGSGAETFFLAHSSSIGDVAYIGPAGASADALLEQAKTAAATKISDKAVPLTGADADLVAAVTSTTVTFRDDSVLAKKLEVGSIIVSGESTAAPDGFLRRITRVGRGGQGILVDTEPASLGDVIIKGSFDVRVSGETTRVSSAGTVSIGGAEVALGNVALPVASPAVGVGRVLGSRDSARLSAGDEHEFSGASNALVLQPPWPALEYSTPDIEVPDDPGTSVAFGAKTSLEETWRVWFVLSGMYVDQAQWWGGTLPSLQKFGMVAWVEHEVKFDYEVSMKVKWSKGTPGGTDEGSTRRSLLPSIAKRAIQKDAELPGPHVRSSFAVWIIPVVMDSYLEPYAKMEGSIACTLKGTIEFETRTRCGAEVDLSNRKVEPVFNVENLSPPLQEPTIEGSGELKVAGGVKIGTRFYGVIGPYVRAELFAKGEYAQAPPAPQPPSSTTTLSVGFESAMGGDLEIASHKFGNLEVKPFTFVFKSWTSPPTNGPAAGSPDSGGGGNGDSGGEVPGTGSGSGVTSLVLDHSGSMSNTTDAGATKMEDAKSAAEVLLDILDGARGKATQIDVGLVQFDHEAQELQAPTSEYRDVRDAVSTLEPAGGTNLLGAIEAGAAQLDDVSPGQRRVMILLSDGVDEAGNSAESIVAAADTARGEGVEIYTIGFGTAGYDIDEELLIAIAGSEKRYSYADPASLTDLAASFIRSGVGSSYQILQEFEGAVEQGETVKTGSFEVPDQSGQMQAVLYWPGSTLELGLEDPNGQKVADGYPGLTVTRTSTPAQVFIENPIPGEWKMSVYGKETSMDEEPYWAVAAFKEASASQVLTSTPASSTTVGVPAGGAPQGGGAGAMLFVFALLLGGGALAAIVSTRGSRTSSDADALVRGLGRSSFVLRAATGREWRLAEGSTSLGRAVDCDVVLDDPGVSRHHATIWVEGVSATLRDEGSAAGTRLNGERVAVARLNSGDEIGIGPVRLTVGTLVDHQDSQDR